MNFYPAQKKTLITYCSLILATVFLAIAYFSSYSAVRQMNYNAEFDVLPTDLQESDSGFRLVDITDAIISNKETKDADMTITPLGIGKIPSLADTSRDEITMYSVLRENDGPISEAEKDRLTEELHWQEYITGAGEKISKIAEEYKNITAAEIRKANCFSETAENVLEDTLLFIPDSHADVEVTRRHAEKVRMETARLTAEENKMHPLAYVIQKGDTIGKVAGKFGLKISTLLSANQGKRFREGTVLTIPPMNGIYVFVQRGDNLSSIARRYGARVSAVMEVNGLIPGKLRAGSKIFIPGGRMPEGEMSSGHVRSGFAGKIMPETGGSVGRFRWPCHGRITSSFGYRRSPFRRRRTVFHSGIDIGAPRGTPVVASASGVVTHTGWMSGYGKTVVISHGGGVSTLYGHNSSILVRNGTSVSRGQIIARVGSTGRSTGNHCHFEIRRGGRPTNPMRVLR